MPRAAILGAVGLAIIYSAYFSAREDAINVSRIALPRPPVPISRSGITIPAKTQRHISIRHISINFEEETTYSPPRRHGKVKPDQKHVSRYRPQIPVVKRHSRKKALGRHEVFHLRQPQMRQTVGHALVILAEPDKVKYLLDIIGEK